MGKNIFSFNGYYYAAIAFVIAASIGFGLYQYREKAMYQLYVSNNYKRSLHDVAGYIDDVDNLLAKVPVIKLPEQSSPIFAEIWRQAGAAHENLISLPYSHEVVVSSLKYLSQVSDFSYTMMMKTMDGGELDADDKKILTQIKKYSESLSSELSTTIAGINHSGEIAWDILKEETFASADSNENINPETLLGSMITVGKTFQNYPELIYDGPFSDHIQNIKPKMTEGKSDITKEEGMETAREICALEEADTVYYIGETPPDAKNTIPVYSYAIIHRDSKEPDMYIDITKQGGLPLWMLNTNDITFKNAPISASQAIEAAQNFLQRNNYNNMKYSYYEISDYSIVINFAPFVNGVIMYPDLIKVKVSLADGTITGFEALGYVSMHSVRVLPQKTMTADEARNYIADDFFVKSTAKAVIPLASGKEAFCFEFKGNYGADDFLIYINAETGKMENIFKLLVNEYGILAE